MELLLHQEPPSFTCFLPKKFTPEENEDLEHCEEQKISWLSLLVRRINVAGFLTEIALILQKLTWLEGKVRIVHAFIPIVAKLVCQKGISEAKILRIQT